MTSWRESPGVMLPLFGAAAGALYGATKEGDKQPLVFGMLGAVVGVFAGVFAGSLVPGRPEHHVGGGRRFPGFQT